MAQFDRTSVISAFTAILTSFDTGEGVPVRFGIPERLDGSCHLLVDLEVAIGWIVYLFCYLIGLVDCDHLVRVVINASVGFIGSFDLNLSPFALEPKCGIHIVGVFVSIFGVWGDYMWREDDRVSTCLDVSRDS